MSQEKVDRYKEEKANRKKNMARAKRNRVITYVILILVALLIVAWIVYSAVNSITRNQAAKQTPVNLDAISDYLMDLNSSDEEQEPGADNTENQEPENGEDDTQNPEDDSNGDAQDPDGNSNGDAQDPDGDSNGDSQAPDSNSDVEDQTGNDTTGE